VGIGEEIRLLVGDGWCAQLISIRESRYGIMIQTIPLRLANRKIVVKKILEKF
jgi:hypothetical protein